MGETVNTCRRCGQPADDDSTIHLRVRACQECRERLTAEVGLLAEQLGRFPAASAAAVTDSELTPRRREALRRAHDLVRWGIQMVADLSDPDVPDKAIRGLFPLLD